jgi:hypothetical protein
MTLTTAQLIGSPAEGTDLNENIEIGNKSTAGSSAIAVGRVVFLTESTGLWAIATAGSTGRMGVIPNLDPVNVDADPSLQVATGIGSEWYVEAAGAIKPGARCMPTTGGKLIQYVAGDVTTTVSEANVEAAIKDFERAPFVYKGHYDEASGLKKKPTDAANGQAIRVRIQK